jgi:sulfate permease, SulP family
VSFDPTKRYEATDAPRRPAVLWSTWVRYLPILGWWPAYSRDQMTNDAMAAVIVTIMLIPQSLAYAMLAGLPPQVGLYASILPLLAYCLFGTSRTLAVGPVAVISLMTAAAVGKLAAQGTVDYATAAVALAFLSGLMGVFRLGFVANYLSHPVISGFITASAILIAASQLKYILGIKANGENLLDLLSSLWANLGQTKLSALLIGCSVTAFLFWARKGLKPFLLKRGWAPRSAEIAARAGPVAAVAVTAIITGALRLDKGGLQIVGTIPMGLPPFALPSFDTKLWGALTYSALLISLVGFVESISVAQTLAAKRRQRIVPDQELIGLGASNIAASFSGGYPVTGGFARSVVNFDAGAETPMAGAFTAGGILLATMFLTPLLYFLPQATLAATIVVAVLSLVDLGALKRTFDYSKNDFLAMLATVAATLGAGVEAGIMAGVALSLALLLYRASVPHWAIVGRVPGTEHFRNVNRHDVLVTDELTTLRIDESLTFINARFLEDTVYGLIADQPRLKHLVLMCPAINHIDASALESLEAINLRLKDAGVTLHLSEVKGPVMDRLRGTHFLHDLTGKVFLSQHDASTQLCALNTTTANSIENTELKR